MKLGIRRNTMLYIFALFCGICGLLLCEVRGATLKRDNFPRQTSVSMSDILLQLDANKLDKRSIKSHADIDENSKRNHSSLQSIETRIENSFINNGFWNKNSSRNNSSYNSSIDKNSEMFRKPTNTKSIKIAKNDNKERRIGRRKKKSKTRERIRKGEKSRKGDRKLKKESTYFRKRNTNYKNKRQGGLKFQESKFNSFSNKHLPRYRFPLQGYRLVPYARLYPLYRPSFTEYPRMQRDRIYYRDPYYDYRYYEDYDTQRKDVIPKPEVAPFAVRGAKKDTFYNENGSRRTAYSPIVSAVQNLDRSEANLFDSLLSPNHESSRLTDDVGSELSNFVASPGELEVYTPTDTPGDFYFEKDGQEPSDDSQTLTTNRPTEFDPSDIVSNEEKLLAIVQKVIEKQKKKEKTKLDAKVKEVKENRTVDIGDTSKVFNTESREAEPVNKLNDFLSKQPKFEKKIKAKTEVKVQGGSKAHAKSKNSPHAKSQNIKVQDVKVQNPGVQRTKATIKSGGRMLKADFKLGKLGQHVIVEDIDPRKDQLLLDSLKHVDEKGRKRIHHLPMNKAEKLRKDRPKQVRGSTKTLGTIDRDGGHNRVIKEVTTSSRGRKMVDNDGIVENNERHNGFETRPLSIHESHTSRYNVNGRDIPVVSELDPIDWFTKEDSLNESQTGAKKDKEKPEEKPQSEKEASADKEATKESKSSGEEQTKEEAKGPSKETKNEASVESNTGKEESKQSAEPQKPAAADEKSERNSTAAQSEKEDEGTIEDLFKTEGNEQTNQQTVQAPLETEIPSPPPSDEKIPGWRIRDYYLDSNNASNWDQIRTAWTGNNESQFVFNNRIQVNPQGTINRTVTMPPIRFINGITMPVLPTISAPTDMTSQGFLNENDDDDDDDENEVQQQQHKLAKQQQQPPKPTPLYGLQYPWQWHNRRPKESRYHNQNLHFHGRPTLSAYRPVSVTTQGPVTSGAIELAAKPTGEAPTRIQGSHYEGATPGGKSEGLIDEIEHDSIQQEQKSQEKVQSEGVKEQGRENEGVKGQNDKEVKGESQKEDKGQSTENKDEKESENEKEQEKEVTEENKTKDESSKHVGKEKSSDERKDHGVIAETATYKNTTLRRLNESKIETFTKAPQELPILNQPTTKSVQNFLPGVKPPLMASNKLSTERKDTYPPWSGGYVEHLRKHGWEGLSNEGNVNADVRSSDVQNRTEAKKVSNAGSELGEILTEESTRKIPYDEAVESKYAVKGKEEAAARESFGYESDILQKEETENAAIRAKVTDSPINRQAEYINDIRHRTTAAEKAAQRQIVLADNATAVGNVQQRIDNQSNATSQAGQMIIPWAGPIQRQLGVWTQPPTTRPKTTTKAIAVSKVMATATTQMGEEFHHPTPKPLFPLNVPIRIPTKARLISQEVKNAPEIPQIVGPVLNGTSELRNRYMPMPYEPATAESTTPSALGYKTTDWAKAFTTTEQAGPTRNQFTNNIFGKNEAIRKVEQESNAERVGPRQETNKAEKGSPTSLATNERVTEGQYQTDEAKLRTTAKVPAKEPERVTEKVPEVSQNVAQNVTPAQNAPVTNVLPYQAGYPTIAVTESKVAPQQNFNQYANGYQGWQGTGSNNVAGSKSTEAVSDAYLTKFGDQLNMEDLYWTDSTEEKEEICRKEKGTNEVIHILCFGDSLTRGYYNKGKSHHPYTNKLQFLLNKLDTKKCYIVENEGKDGELAYEEMPKRLETLLKDGDTKYEWTVILGGTNDIYNKKKSKSVSESAITQNIISMHEIARKHNSKSVAVTIPEVYCETQETCQDARQLREKVNNNIRNYAIQNQDRVVLVDLADMLQRSNVGKDMVAQFFEGGLHLKPRGYERMAIIIYEGIKKALS